MRLTCEGVKVVDPIEIRIHSMPSGKNIFEIDRRDLANIMKTYSGRSPNKSGASFASSLNIRPGEPYPNDSEHHASCDMAAVSRLVFNDYPEAAQYVRTKRKTDPSYPDLTLGDFREIRLAKSEFYRLPNDPDTQRIIAKLMLRGAHE